jgi:hypothetical protein
MFGSLFVLHALGLNRRSSLSTIMRPSIARFSDMPGGTYTNISTFFTQYNIPQAKPTYVSHFFLHSPTHLFHRTPGGATPASSDKKASFNTVSPHLLYHNHLTTPNISTLTLPIKSSTAYAPQLPLQRLPPALCRSPLFHHPFRYRRVFPFSHTLASSSS